MTELVCIICPRGCHLYVDEENGYAVEGNFCGRGSEYGRSEVQDPVRMLTSTVYIEEAEGRCLPVKTSKAVPKKDIFRVMTALKGLTVQAPVKTGDVVLKDVCGIGADWIATKDMGKRK